MTTLSAEALAALQLAVADHNSVRAPLITDLLAYAEVDRVLARLAGGGRWEGRDGAYVYSRDPRPDLQALTGSVAIPPPSATRDKELSYWPTPPVLAKELVNGLDLEPGMRLLEPSAGDGALVRAIQEAYSGVHITAVEPDRARCTVLRRSCSQGVDVLFTTFEEFADLAPPSAATRFDAVVMNPPFTLPDRRYAWAEHVALAWDQLRPGGQLRAIVPASLEYGRQRLIAAARALITDAGGTWSQAPDGAFRTSGTDVYTLIVEATK